MDLPDDMLGEIFFMLLGISWVGFEFALCNRRMLGIFQDQARRMLWYSYLRPYVILGRVMIVYAVDIVTEADFEAVHYGAKLLHQRKLDKLILVCRSVEEFTLDGKTFLVNWHVADYHVEQVLGPWPVHKVDFRF